MREGKKRTLTCVTVASSHMTCKCFTYGRFSSCGRTVQHTCEAEVNFWRLQYTMIKNAPFTNY